MLRTTISIFIFLFMILQAGSSQVQSRIDSLQNLLDTSSPEEKVDIFCQISELYWQRSYDTSLLMAVHARNSALETGNPNLTATAMYMIGNANYLLGDYPGSIENYLEALELWEEADDSSNIASSYNNMGAVYLHMNDEKRALEYFKKSGKIFRALNDDEQLFPILNNIGAVYLDNEIMDTAFQYFSEALEIAERSGNQTNLSIVLTNLGETTLYMGLYSQSEAYQTRAYEISRQLGDLGMMATIKSNHGKLHLRKRDYALALESFQESLVLAREINSLPIMQENYQSLSEYYNLKGEYRQALRLYKLYSSMKDSIMSQEGMMEIKELELKFNARALQQEIELLRKDNEIQSLKQTRLKYGVISLVILILASALGFLSYFQRNRFKKETNRLLEDKNSQLEKANKKLVESEKHLKELNSTKDKFFSIIGHDLRNPLNALLGFSELISGNSREYSPEEIQKYSKIINEAAKNIHQLIENLLEWSRSQSGNIEFNPGQTDLNQVIDEILKIIEIQAEKKSISIEKEVPEKIQVFADRNLLSTILRNLINNGVKFTPKKGTVKVSADQTDTGVSISVSDTGVGMSQEQLDSIFSLAHGPSTAGTEEEKGTGLGLILCKEFVDKHGGEIQVESQSGKGSTFTFILPGNN